MQVEPLGHSISDNGVTPTDYGLYDLYRDWEVILGFQVRERALIKYLED